MLNFLSIFSPSVLYVVYIYGILPNMLLARPCVTFCSLNYDFYLSIFYLLGCILPLSSKTIFNASLLYRLQGSTRPLWTFRDNTRMSLVYPWYRNIIERRCRRGHRLSRCLDVNGPTCLLLLSTCALPLISYFPRSATLIDMND